MTDYPYIQNTGRLKQFLTKIQTIGVPNTITQTNLPSLGFKSNNDRPMVKILTFIGFLDSANKPTDSYRDFKLTKKTKAVMASALKSSYAELFTLYPDAKLQSQDNLRDFFASKTSSGEQVIGLQISTFKALAEFADFGAIPSQDEEEEVEEPRQKDKRREGLTPQIAINLQIQLPESTDPKTYEAIFKAMAEYLLKGST